LIGFPEHFSGLELLFYNFPCFEGFSVFCKKPNIKVARSGRGGLMEPIFRTGEEK